MGKKFLKAFFIFCFFLTVLVLVIGMAFLIYVNRCVEKSIDESIFTMVASDSASKFYYYEEASDGSLEARELAEEELYGEYRCVYVDYGEVPSYMKDAFVSIEDKRFYSHKGVDWKRTLSAGFNYFLKFSGSFGGSTITQQLIKNVTDKDEYSFRRKIQEILWALDLETKMTKEEILGQYMNIINLSHGCYGIGAAADYYFSKSVSELTLNECACIAAITNNPSYYDPVRNPDHNFERKTLILREMYAQGYITEEEYRSAIDEEVVLNLRKGNQKQTVRSWYTDMVIEDVIKDLMREKGYSRSMASLMIYTGGLQIYTAMDREIQEIMEDYYEKTSHFYSGSPQEAPQSAMIVIHPENGNILGVVGAIGEKSANRVQNFATQTVRPAGSVIKPLAVYAPALEEGVINWASVYDDVPITFEQTSNGDWSYWPKNSDGGYRGLCNVNDALKYSVNTVSIRILEDLGVERSFDFLYEKLGMKSLIRSGVDGNGNAITDCDLAALGLGQMNYGVSVREVTAAYSAFANEGVYNQCRSYYKVTDYAGSILLEKPYAGEAVLSEESASLMTAMLQNVVASGTAKALTLQNQIDCAGKTGTTQSNYDRWYVGYTPYYIGGVWYGYEYPKSLSGGNRCIEIWDEIMTRIHEKKLSTSEQRDPKEFSVHENLLSASFCKDSGLPTTEACLRDPRGDRTEVGYFVKGSEPVGFCPTHVPVLYDRDEGGVCLFDACPSDSVDRIGLICIVRSFPTQIYVNDAQYVWREVTKKDPIQYSPSLPFFTALLKEGEYCGISRSEVQYNRACKRHARKE